MPLVVDRVARPAGSGNDSVVRERQAWLFIMLMAAAGMAGCSANRAAPRPFPTPPTANAAVPPPTLSPIAASAAGTALSFAGVPYKTGGANPYGFDCSGFVAWIYAAHGVRVPRTVAEQFRATVPIADAVVTAGDLVFFATTARSATHVGIALGDGRFVHSPNSRGAVRVDRMDATYWSQRYLGARRVPVGASE